MTTQLAAVQRIASALGFPRPTALQTGQATDAGRIEDILNEVLQDVQKQGLAFNRLVDYEIALPTIRIPVGAGGNFTFGETITESVSGATGKFNRIESSNIHISPLTGTFTGSQLLTGSTSGDTRTGSGADVVLTSNKIGIPSTWLNVVGASRAISQRGLFLWDSVESTTTFTGSVKVHAVENVAIADIPYHWAEAIIWQAAVEANINFKRAAIDHQLLTERAAHAMAQAYNHDQDQAPVNVFNSPQAESVIGRRYGADGTSRYG